MTLYKWSQTASADATADSTINWAEGQAPSSVNDSARAMMAATAKYRDDNGGNLSTGGTSTAYTLTTNQVFDTQAHMNAQSLTFQVNVTNGASPTLNVDGLGAAALIMDGLNAVPAGTMIAGGVYTAVYYSSVNQWRLKGLYQLPFTVPVGGMIDYFGAASPGSNFIFPYGQAISRATYSALFTLFSTTYGVGDGSTTFNVPDLRGRVAAGRDDMGGSAASRLTSTWFGADATVMGATGSSNEKNALSSTNQLPQFTPAGTITNGAITFPSVSITSAATGANTAVATGTLGGSVSLTTVLNPSQASSTFTGTAAGSASPSSFRTVQPTIICNKLLRII